MYRRFVEDVIDELVDEYNALVDDTMDEEESDLVYRRPGLTVTQKEIDAAQRAYEQANANYRAANEEYWKVVGSLQNARLNHYGQDVIEPLEQRRKQVERRLLSADSARKAARRRLDELLRLPRA
jgi:multidrug resistance efflux pump